MNTIDILNKVQNGELSPSAAQKLLHTSPFKDLGFANVDLHRKVRQGASEVIYGAGKTGEQILKITDAMLKQGEAPILITRISRDKAELLINSLSKDITLHYDELANICIAGNLPAPDGDGKILVATGGTSDMPVAEEAAKTAEFLGNEVIRIYDVGVSGLHRLLSRMDEIVEARVVIAIAGMEGALASVIGGLVKVPVIGVPTSVGYGASFNGLAALLSMLNSCASGTAVVNIDNGFGAGFLASRINHMK